MHCTVLFSHVQAIPFHSFCVTAIVLDHFVWTEFATNGIKRDVGDPLVVMLAPQML